jgi:hypothetical protein
MFFLSLVWANHGDEISIQYSGTPALKGDFVRYFPWIYSSFSFEEICMHSYNFSTEDH